MKRFAQILLVFIAGVALMGTDFDRARFEKLGHEMVCTCGCNQILLECNHVGCPASDGMRKEMTGAMNSGKTDPEVLTIFVSKYGPTVLAAPTKSGFNLAAWIMPFALFFAGLAVAILVVRNWKFRPAGATTSAAPRTEHYRAQVRQETEL